MKFTVINLCVVLSFTVISNISDVLVFALLEELGSKMCVRYLKIDFKKYLFISYWRFYVLNSIHTHR